MLLVGLFRVSAENLGLGKRHWSGVCWSMKLCCHGGADVAGDISQRGDGTVFATADVRLVLLFYNACWRADQPPFGQTQTARCAQPRARLATGPTRIFHGLCAGRIDDLLPVVVRWIITKQFILLRRRRTAHMQPTTTKGAPDERSNTAAKCPRPPSCKSLAEVGLSLAGMMGHLAENHVPNQLIILCARGLLRCNC
jgi:hypothetical protein